MDLLKELYGKLPDDKFKINGCGQRHLIKLEKFLFFLTVHVTKSKNNLGISNGWVMFENDKLGLFISGGRIKNIEYLNTLRFGKNLSNPYNNYVNPFYLHEILTKKGIDFFKVYYADEISKRIDSLHKEINNTKIKLNRLTNLYNKINEKINPQQPSTTKPDTRTK